MDQSYSLIKPNQEILDYEPTSTDKKTKIGKNTIKRLNLPINYDQNVEQFLNYQKSEIIYIQGRDHSYRSIIVLNAYKVKFNQFDQYLRELEIVVNQMMVYIIYLLNQSYQVKSKIGLSQLILIIKKLMDFKLMQMQLLLTCNIIKEFLEQTTSEKVILVGGNRKQLFQFVNKEQIEEKFGRLQTNRVEF